MTAFSNTAALVYRNGRNGTTHDVIPMNFFVNSHILEPSSDESKKITVSSFSWESYFYGDYESGNIKSKDDPFSAKTAYSCYKDMFTPWLMPSMSDLFYIFSGDKPEISSLTETSPFGPGVFDINEKVKVFMTCGSVSAVPPRLWTMSIAIGPASRGGNIWPAVYRHQGEQLQLFRFGHRSE